MSASEVIVNTARFRTVTNLNGHEIIELLDSDDEMEFQPEVANRDTSDSEDKGMSSDTMVASGDFDIKMDSDDDDEEPNLFQDRESLKNPRNPKETTTLTQKLLQTGSMTAFRQLSR